MRRHCAPLYRFLKKSDIFVWIVETDATLSGLKKMPSIHILVAPVDKNPMFLYIAAAN